MSVNRPGLTRQSIIEAALRLLKDVGLDGLTVRRLAASLGVQSPALYWHFRSKDQLLDGMADEIIRSAAIGLPGAGETWRQWLLRGGRAYRSALLAHRDGARIVAGFAVLTDTSIARFEAELSAMVAAGFTPLGAFRTIKAISQYVNGFVLQEQTERAGGPELSAMPPTLLEALVSGGIDRDAEFEHGLQALIAGTSP
ncbi:TetR/AcrR family transcriptional regulator C-terminal domain-containing protein [Actinocrispum sp. NPDC049592]|uniref:TetR/AcrR family transcriptional regulator C-terminal domain-containing protein n=1 Tax=Actinocrispum sp. NPDC049592 TaxID=3154835 RepID=UPI0034330CB5